MLRALVFVAAALAACTAAAGEPTTLRIATVAPDGTTWARELRAWARDTEAAANGGLRIKIYFGGIGGPEEMVLERIRREQLDGTIASELCTTLAPSLRVGRIIGVFRSRDENAYVLSRLKQRVDEEFRKNGFINFGSAGLGSELLWTREPIPDLAAMRKLRWWVWSSDTVLPPQARALGLTVVQTPLETAGKTFEAGGFDGFITIPSAALAFQWTTQVRYVTTLGVSFRSGCLLLATRAFDALPTETQEAMRASAGKLYQRIEATGRAEDEALLGGLLAKQGVHVLKPSDRLADEFFEAASSVRPSSRVVGEDVIREIMGWLADYRAEHR